MSPRQPHQWNTDGEAEDQYVSRSQRKRDSHALQRMSEELVTCSPAIQNKLPLTDAMREALVEYRRTPSREAKRRQQQYLGRLMREEEDSVAISAALETLRHTGIIR